MAVATLFCERERWCRKRSVPSCACSARLDGGTRLTAATRTASSACSSRRVGRVTGGGPRKADARPQPPPRGAADGQDADGRRVPGRRVRGPYLRRVDHARCVSLVAGTRPDTPPITPTSR
jgi:hypothetical protein